MPENLKARMAKMKKRLAIPREQYLAAVKRQEHRAWANWTDPRRDVEMRTLLAMAKNQILVSQGKDPEPLPNPEPVDDPNPTVFDTKDQITRDDALIEAYLTDNPGERRRSDARGHTQDELLVYWHSSPEGLGWHEQIMRILKPKMSEFRDHILAEGP